MVRPNPWRSHLWQCCPGVAGIAVPDQRDSALYQPARPAHVREALRAIPVRDLSAYTYIDLGSGKGRTLFVAAEFSFQRILGVEFSPTLHRQACENIRNFRRHRRSIQSIYQNVADFRFPDDPLVLYMFNPFGAATMQLVLDHLESSSVIALQPSTASARPLGSSSVRLSTPQWFDINDEKSATVQQSGACLFLVDAYRA